jgi:anti-anti-sigma regulatory factor
MRVSYLGSAGIGVIIACKGKLTDRFPDRDSGIVVLNPIDSVRDVFNLLEISDAINIVSTEEEAVEKLNSLE